jgi:FKBP12-rapamycin complex-associated protein
MSLIVQIIGSHIRNYLDEVFQLTRDLWPNLLLRLPIVALIESLANAMGAEFKPYLPAVIPQLLTVFNQPEGTERSLAEVKVFQAMLAFGSAVEEYLHLILPFILATLERPTGSRDSRRVAVETIGELARRINLTESVSRIIQPLVRTLPAVEKSLSHVIMDTICILLVQLGPDFAVFVPRIRNVSFSSVFFAMLTGLQTLSEHRIPALKFEELADRLMKGEPLPQELGSEEK